MPVYWGSGGPAAHSLFRNFAHLVSLTNLALKRTMNMEKVVKYRHHTLEYLKSCLILFPDVMLAPNHHMSVHLGDCLEKFGPSRAWWSFSMERLMGSILKASHNNRLALMSAPEKFPTQIRPFLSQMQSINAENQTSAQSIHKGQQEFVDEETLKLLIDKINTLFPAPNSLTWISASEWCKKSTKNAKNFLSVNSVAENLSTYSIENINYTTYKKNPSNSVIKLKPSCTVNYGIIRKIFLHQRSSGTSARYNDTWILIQPLLPANFSDQNPFSKLGKYELQVDLRIPHDSMHLIHTTEVYAHCAWIKFQPFEISKKINMQCIALVSLER
ncbi:hypothetical protein PPACK8108_LOCUS11497 [Phakopsora pachyrhizi]|uniref:DUF4218 domain-containing protein n=1 Tax=Phakopsora pachyrhizi TaxID=170000 RepID=A0AAV0B2F2_PHAPC|nr:hypothetical protein PPACK8108_LOCUS11497 [Phakopsora pachyrhizi]